MLKFSGAALAAGLAAGVIYFDSPLYGMVIFLFLMTAYPMYRAAEEKKKQQELLLEFRDLLYSISASLSLGRNMKQALEESLSFWGNTYDEKDIIVRETRMMLKEMEETGVTKSGSQVLLERTGELNQEFLKQMGTLVKELTSHEATMTQHTKNDNCKYCNFVDICRRDVPSY